VRLLLEHGSDPNQPIDNKSEGHAVWDLFILNSYNICKELVDPQPSAIARLSRAKDLWYEAAEFMIDHGAGLNMEVEIGKKEMVSIHMKLEAIFGAQQAARLALRMEEVAARCNRPPPPPPPVLIFWRLLGWT
jgi:hypothetical protein